MPALFGSEPVQRLGSYRRILFQNGLFAPLQLRDVLSAVLQDRQLVFGRPAGFIEGGELCPQLVVVQ
jgi:hypothetical protein